jgi:hypothetical protein
MDVCLLVDSGVGLPEGVNERYGRSVQCIFDMDGIQSRRLLDLYFLARWKVGRGARGMAGGSVREVGGDQRIAPRQNIHPGRYIHFEPVNT